MAELGQALAIVMAVNALLFLGQAAVLDINPTGVSFYDCSDTIIGQFEAYNCDNTTYLIDDTDPLSQLPQDSGEVDTGTGNIFTDTYNAIRGWFNSAPGVNYIYSILAAPSNFLKAIKVPDAYAFAIGVMWYGFTLFLIVSYFFGRDY